MENEVLKSEVFSWNRIIGCEVLIGGRQDWIVGTPRDTMCDFVVSVSLSSGEKVDIFDCMFYIDDETLVTWIEYYNHFYGRL